ncbi:MAG: DUF1624 domain-containing protein [Acidobacteria bacterium]|nr:DUF1624 domain-containing protein [Acidobacteriota bacterium]
MPPAQRSTRRPYLDWLRGLAVLIMIEAHTINAWTMIADQSGRVYAWAMIVGGFGAPSFLFLAGVGVVLSATAKAAKTGSARAAAARVARRGGEIFGLAFLFRLQSFLLNPTAPLVSLLKVDILNIMGPSMAAAAWLWGLPRRDSRRLLALIAAMIAAGTLTPLVRELRILDALPDPLESYLRPLPGRTNFVLFPWAAFLFGGAAVGLVLVRTVGPPDRLRQGYGGPGPAEAGLPTRPAKAEAGHHEVPEGRRPEVVDGRRERRAVIGVGAAGLVLAVGSYYGSYLPSLFAWSSFWTSSPSFFFLRLGILLMSLPLALFSPSLFPLERFGRSSLFVYWVHVELAYGVATMPLHRRLPIEWAFFAFGVFAVGMYGLVVVKDRIVGIRGSGSGIRGSLNPSNPSPESRSECDHVSHLRDERAIEELAGARVVPLVVHEIEIAERPVNDVEPDVRAPLFGVGVVLKQRVQEHPRVEAVDDAARDEIRRVGAGREVDVVVGVIQRGIESFVQPHGAANLVRPLVAVVEVPRPPPEVERHSRRRVRSDEREVLGVAVTPRGNHDAALRIDREGVEQHIGAGIDAKLDEGPVLELERQVIIDVPRLQAPADSVDVHELPVWIDLAEPAGRASRAEVHPEKTVEPVDVRALHVAHLVVEPPSNRQVRPADVPE